MTEYAFIAVEKAICGEIAKKIYHNKKHEKAEKADDGEDDDALVLYLLTMEIKKENVPKKVWFMEEHLKESLVAVFDVVLIMKPCCDCGNGMFCVNVCVHGDSISSKEFCIWW